MFDLGYITNEEQEKALQEKTKFHQFKRKRDKAPHFVMFIKSYLERKIWKDVVEQNGLKVTTTLDIKITGRSRKNGGTICSRERNKIQC